VTRFGGELQSMKSGTLLVEVVRSGLRDYWRGKGTVHIDWVWHREERGREETRLNSRFCPHHLGQQSQRYRASRCHIQGQKLRYSVGSFNFEIPNIVQACHS
jgi:hypothetical protein